MSAEDFICERAFFFLHFENFFLDGVLHDELVYGDRPGVQHLLHLKSKSKILQPIEIMGFFMNFFVKFKEIFCCNCCIFISDVI